MRTYHVIGIAILMDALGVRVFFFSSSTNDAQLELPTKASLDVFQMHLDLQKVKDIPVLDLRTQSNLTSKSRRSVV